ncbi:uncharacterized protein [Equus przewalskii]|uniref:Uncharacterized protein isoform X2 n=1 Tax=Equus przewalskii TaxID=9798 RepID=A0ABM4KB72_EQUPR
MGSSWQRMSQPCSPGCAGPKQQTRASERCRSQRTRSRMEGSFLTTAPRRSIFPAWPFLAGHVGAPKTHPPGARHRLDASAGRQSAAGALLPWQARTLPLGPLTVLSTAHSCWSRQDAPVMAAWTPPSPVTLPSGAAPFVPQASCRTTEAPRRGFTPALGLPPLRRGARSHPGPVQLHCEGAGAGGAGATGERASTGGSAKGQGGWGQGSQGSVCPGRSPHAFIPPATVPMTTAEGEPTSLPSRLSCHSTELGRREDPAPASGWLHPGVQLSRPGLASLLEEHRGAAQPVPYVQPSPGQEGTLLPGAAPFYLSQLQNPPNETWRAAALKEAPARGCLPCPALRPSHPPCCSLSQAQREGVGSANN